MTPEEQQRQQAMQSNLQRIAAMRQQQQQQQSSGAPQYGMTQQKSTVQMSQHAGPEGSTQNVLPGDPNDYSRDMFGRLGDDSKYLQRYRMANPNQTAEAYGARPDLMQAKSLYQGYQGDGQGKDWSDNALAGWGINQGGAFEVDNRYKGLSEKQGLITDPVTGLTRAPGVAGNFSQQVMDHYDPTKPTIQRMGSSGFLGLGSSPSTAVNANVDTAMTGRAAQQGAIGVDEFVGPDGRIYYHNGNIGGDPTKPIIGIRSDRGDDLEFRTDMAGGAVNVRDIDGRGNLTADKGQRKFGFQGKQGIQDAANTALSDIYTQRSLDMLPQRGQQNIDLSNQLLNSAGGMQSASINDPLQQQSRTNQLAALGQLQGVASGQDSVSRMQGGLDRAAAYRQALSMQAGQGGVGAGQYAAAQGLARQNVDINAHTAMAAAAERQAALGQLNQYSGAMRGMDQDRAAALDAMLAQRQGALNQATGLAQENNLADLQLQSQLGSNQFTQRSNDLLRRTGGFAQMAAIADADQGKKTDWQRGVDQFLAPAQSVVGGVKGFFNSQQ